MIRVMLPHHLRVLAGVTGEVRLQPEGALTLRSVLDALELRHPPLRGAIREHGSGKRRKLVRFFVCGEDWSHVEHDTALPEAIRNGQEPVLIVGAIAGG